jgi:hypothetical protein
LQYNQKDNKTGRKNKIAEVKFLMKMAGYKMKGIQRVPDFRG